MNLANKTSCRAGLSVIEVLTAIVVALIGLAGVLVMIPFAVSQAEIGMDTEKSVDLARNVTEELEIRGVLEGPPLVSHPVPTPLNPYLYMSNATARCYCLDPSGVADRVAGGNDTGSFPFIHPAAVTAMFAGPPVPGTNAVSSDQTCLLQRASLADPAMASALPPAIVPMRKALARSAFSWQDDLQSRGITDTEFADPTVNVGNQYLAKELMLPIPLFDQSITGSGVVLNARRQSLGEMSTVVISCPAVITPRIRTVSPPAIGPTTADFRRDPTGTSIATKSYPSGFPSPPSLPDQSIDASDIISEIRSFYLVYKRRPSPVLLDDVSTAAPATADPQAYDRFFEVDWPGNTRTGVGDPLFRISRNGGMLKLRDRGVTYDGSVIDPSMGTSNDLSKQRAEIRRGDWMALTNVSFDYGTGRFQHNINFYQVVNAYYDIDTIGNFWAITLNGPEWDFQRNYRVEASIARIPFDPNPGNPSIFSAAFGRALIIDNNPNFDYYPSKTLAIHLPDVWTVFERTTRTGD